MRNFFQRDMNDKELQIYCNIKSETENNTLNRVFYGWILWN